MGFPLPAALEYLQRRYGGFLRPYNTPVTCTSAGTRIIGDSGERVCLTIVNVGTVTCNIAAAQDLLGTAYIPLTVGNMLSLSLDEDALLPTLAWYARGSGASGQLYLSYVQRESWNPYEVQSTP